MDSLPHLTRRYAVWASDNTLAVSKVSLAVNFQSPDSSAALRRFVGVPLVLTIIANNFIVSKHWQRYLPLHQSSILQPYPTRLQISRKSASALPRMSHTSTPITRNLQDPRPLRTRLQAYSTWSVLPLIVVFETECADGKSVLYHRILPGIASSPRLPRFSMSPPSSSPFSTAASRLLLSPIALQALVRNLSYFTFTRQINDLYDE